MSASPDASRLRTWLHDNRLSEYCDGFKAQGWVLLEDVARMGEKDLKACGLEKPGHLRRALYAITALKALDDNTGPTHPSSPSFVPFPASQKILVILCMSSIPALQLPNARKEADLIVAVWGDANVELLECENINKLRDALRDNPTGSFPVWHIIAHMDVSLKNAELNSSDTDMVPLWGDDVVSRKTFFELVNAFPPRSLIMEGCGSAETVFALTRGGESKVEEAIGWVGPVLDSAAMEHSHLLHSAARKKLNEASKGAAAAKGARLLLPQFTGEAYDEAHALLFSRTERRQQLPQGKGSPVGSEVYAEEENPKDPERVKFDNHGRPRLKESPHPIAAGMLCWAQKGWATAILRGDLPSLPKFDDAEAYVRTLRGVVRQIISGRKRICFIGIKAMGGQGKTVLFFPGSLSWFGSTLAAMM